MSFSEKKLKSVRFWGSNQKWTFLRSNSKVDVFGVDEIGRSPWKSMAMRLIGRVTGRAN